MILVAAQMGESMFSGLIKAVNRCFLRALLPMFVMALAVGSCFASPPTNGLVAYFPFDSDANDASGNGNHGLVNGGVSLAPAKVGKGVKFNGVNSAGRISNPDFIRVPNSQTLQFGNAMSVSYWIRVDGNQSQTGADCSGNTVFGVSGVAVAKQGDRSGWYSMEYDKSSSFGIAGGTGASTAGLPNAFQNFRHVVRSISGNTIQTYINGDLVSNVVGRVNFTQSNSNDLYIGVQATANACIPYWYPLDGVIDELRIYNRAVSAGEVQEIYQYTGSSPVALAAPVMTVSPSATPAPGTTISISFSPVANATGYRLCAGFSSGVYIGCMPIISPAVFPLGENFDAYAVIQAVNGDVLSNYSNELHITTNSRFPLLTTTWNQISVDADFDGDGYASMYVPGCTSVAVGQLINYYLKNGHASGWLDAMLQNTIVYPRIESCRSSGADCSETILPLTLEGYATLDSYADANDDDVNSLLQFTALGLDSRFSKNGTGAGNNGGGTNLQVGGLTVSDAWSAQVLSLLQDRFRFNLLGSSAFQAGAFIRNSDLPSVKESLDRGNPVLAGVFGMNLSKNKPAGHAVVIDGYRTTNGVTEVHINFGWGENCNTALWRDVTKPLVAYHQNRCANEEVWLRFDSTKLLFVAPM